MGEEERAGQRMIKFTAVVALNCLDGGVELRAHIGKKVRYDAKGFRFQA